MLFANLHINRSPFKTFRFNIQYTLVFFRTSNFGAEAERSYCFVNLSLKCSYDVLKLPVIVSQ